MMSDPTTRNNVHSYGVRTRLFRIVSNCFELSVIIIITAAAATPAAATAAAAADV